MVLEIDNLSQYIAEEMRQASRGSFPLSPGVMDGHYATAKLYWHFRQDFLGKSSVSAIFGKENPDPPFLQLPGGHRDVSIDGLNKLVWDDFLATSFTKRPAVNPTTEVRDLISINASSDIENFDRRLRGEKSRLVMADGRPVPSLLRAFLYDGAFPEKSMFFYWLLDEMKSEVKIASQVGYKDTWSRSLGTLVGVWNTHFQNSPFIPSK